MENIKSLQTIAKSTAGKIARRGEGVMPSDVLNLVEAQLVKRKWYFEQCRKARYPQLLAVALWAWNCHLPQMSVSEWAEVNSEHEMTKEIKFYFDMVNS